MEIKTFRGGYDDNFTYVLYQQDECIIIDPAVPAKEVFDFIKEKKLKVKFVVVMHGHFDHIVDLDKYRGEGIPIYAHKSSEIDSDKKLEDNDVLNCLGEEIKVLHTPGHIYDAICLQINNWLFTSDTLFVNGCGRVDLKGSDPYLMVKTLERLKNLSDDFIIFPGHDYGPTKTSTIAHEKKQNKFLLMGKEEFIRMRTG
jgi:hydroxyacylglutathione hydrolase